jgi:hypothetical protein
MVPIERGAHHVARAWRLSERWGVQEAVVVVLAFLVYFLVRGAAITREDEAVARARDIVDLQQALGFNWELQMQSWIIDHYWPVKVMNWIYFWGHMPLVIMCAVYLFARHRREYYLALLPSGRNFPRLWRNPAGCCSKGSRGYPDPLKAHWDWS